MDFTKKLRHIQYKNQSLLCIGLDTDAEKTPRFLRRFRSPQYEFNRLLIEATQDLVCAYKLNLAFYESTGETGYRTIHRTLAVIPQEIVTIADGKRGDIGNTAARYASLIFENWKFDATTISPYMGYDSVEPFLKRRDRCAFVLALTSNRGSRDFQYLSVNGRPLYEHVARAAGKWNKKRNVGLVVGATHPAELKRIRSHAREMPILIPGIGAQRGDLQAAVRYGCNAKGELAVINIGRSIIYASGGKDFAQKARETAQEYRKQMEAYRKEYFPAGK
ncbi:MAG: orotidine-5'-phosphate decarboxylase [Bacteroidota bacterium]|jgi:orotidine-5'-phosphate decarboxylase